MHRRVGIDGRRRRRAGGPPLVDQCELVTRQPASVDERVDPHRIVGSYSLPELLLGGEGLEPRQVAEQSRARCLGKQTCQPLRRQRLRSAGNRLQDRGRLMAQRPLDGTLDKGRGGIRIADEGKHRRLGVLQKRALLHGGEWESRLGK